MNLFDLSVISDYLEKNLRFFMKCNNIVIYLQRINVGKDLLTDIQSINTIKINYTMKKIFIMIAAIVGVAIVSCSKPEESVSVNPPIQKTVQYDEDVEMLRYYESLVDLLDSICLYETEYSYYTDSIALCLFNEQWSWLFCGSSALGNTTLFGSAYLSVENELFRDYSQRPMDRPFVESIINDTELLPIEKMSLLDLAATFEVSNRYKRCCLLLEINGQNYYYTGDFREILGDSILTRNIALDIPGVPEGSVLVVYKNLYGEFDYGIVSYSWLCENEYQYVTDEERAAICLAIYIAEQERICNENRRSRRYRENTINDIRTQYGSVLPGDLEYSKLFNRKMQRELKQAERSYQECLGIDSNEVKEVRFEG